MNTIELKVASMSSYTVTWVPIGPEISVTCQSLEEALALADELVTIGKIDTIRVMRGDEVISSPTSQNNGDAVH